MRMKKDNWNKKKLYLNIQPYIVDIYDDDDPWYICCSCSIKFNI